jgi:manganese/zinc/iron transport system substrate-binding protein
MKNIPRFLIGAAVAAVTACGGSATQTADNRIGVVATTNIVADLVQTVGGDSVRVEALMGPGIDPHLYKASAGDARRMSSADVIFYSGLHLEGKMSEVLEQMGERGIRTVAVTDCMPEEELITASGFSGIHDPHVWFDVVLWSKTASCVAEALIELDPAGAGGYRQRADSFIGELEELDRWVRRRVAELAPERRVLVTAHDAFSYFGRAYGFEVRGLLGISTASEAGTSDVQELADFIADRKIPAIFVETSVPPRFIQALQEAVRSRGFAVEIGGSLFSDSLGDEDTPEGTYPGTVHANVETIVTALGRDVDIK